VNKYSKYESIPDAHLLLSSLRSVGYTEETAIADIIDNCISANASNINVYFDWDKQRILICDDGHGMSKENLLKSMKIGSADPGISRHANDLGRFGMGMKTAAFSLGKKLTIISKENQSYANACWDLESIERQSEWKMLIAEEVDLLDIIDDELKENLSGTTVIIENLDKLIDGNNLQKAKIKFYTIIKKIKNHLGLVFHRYIEEDELVIKVNKQMINPWNPFIINNIATQELATEEYVEDEKYITIEPFVLPHKTKFGSEEDFELAAGPKGWLQHQGFYVYRNRRLLVYGTWFNKLKKEPSFNLARIKLDITSESDFDWNIDIKKSKAVPPVYIDDLIDKITNIVSQKSATVYNSRGTYAKNTSTNITSLKYVWEQRKTSTGKYMFYLNKKHPMLMKLNQELSEAQTKDLKSYLSLIENFAPSMISGVTNTMNVASDTDVPNYIKEKDIIRVKELISTYKTIGFDNDEIFDVIASMPEYTYIKIDIKKILA